VLERDVLKACLDLLAYRGIFHWRQNAGVIPAGDGRYRRFVGKKGLPDIWAVLPPHGTLLAIETKAPGRKMSPDQQQFHEDLVKLGGISCCVSSVDELAKDLEGLI
jgi:hypothetical protein